MSQIDLKYATIYVRDGYTGPGGSPAVNNALGYASGAVTMTIDGVTGSLSVGDLFTVVGSTATHRITSHTETSTNTTSITFTPGLTGAVVDDAVITIGPHTLEVHIGEGNAQWTEKRNIEYKKDRGRLDEVREGDQEPVEVRLDAMWEFLRSVSGADTPTIEEALKGIGAASAWVSSDPDTCRPYAVDIEIFYEPNCDNVYRERIILNDFRWESMEHDAKAGMINTQGKCNITQATVSRIAP